MGGFKTVNFRELFNPTIGGSKGRTRAPKGPDSVVLAYEFYET